MRKAHMLFLLALVPSLAFAQKKTEVPEFNSKDYRMVMTMMNPMSYPTQDLSGGYYVDLKGDSCFVHLPYMGDVHSATAMDGGLNYESPVRDLKVTTNKKGTAKKVSFTLGQGHSTCQFFLTIGSKGYVTLNVTPRDAQPCSYQGRKEDRE